MMRTLIVLLILRVVAAPITARPDAPTPLSQGRFIVRVCAWPAERPRRLAAGSDFSVRPGNHERDPSPASPVLRACAEPTRGRLSLLMASALGDRPPVRLSDCPRC
jgi:hypothetical protein